MAIEKRIGDDGKPRYYVRYDTKDPITGHRKRHRVPGSFTNKKQAEAAEREAILNRDRGRHVDPAKSTLAELLDTWLTDKAATVTPNTIADYRQVINSHIKPALGTIPIQKLTAATIHAQYGRWRDAGLSPRMIRGAHMRLSQALDQAVRHKLLLHNPAKDVTPPTLPRTGFKVWDADESRRFLAASQSDTYAPLWDVLLREGMRRGEALGLRWGDINWQRGTAHIAQTVAPNKNGGGGPIIQSRTKTKAGARTVRLTAETIAALQALKDRRTWGENEAVKPTPDGLIFCTRDGKVLNPNNITRNYNAIVEAAGVRRIKLHEMRHTSATLMLLAGISAKVVSERLGHASIAITLDIYSHVLPSMQDDAAEAMSRVLSG